MGAAWQDASRGAPQAQLLGLDAAGPSTLTPSENPVYPTSLGAEQALGQPCTFQQLLLQGAGQDTSSSDNSGDASLAAESGGAALQEQPQQEHALRERGSRSREEGSRHQVVPVHRGEAGRNRSKRAARCMPVPCFGRMMAADSGFARVQLAAWLHAFMMMPLL